MKGRHPRCRQQEASRLDRRTFLSASAAVTGLGLAALGSSASLGSAASGAEYEGPRAAPDAPMGYPGPYPGRVIEVQHADSVHNGEPNRDVVRQMIQTGMTALTKIDEPVEAWRSMFEPGDVVGIKVNPVGQPLSISNYATVHALVEALESAGVRRQDIIVFDRFRDQFVQAGYEANLPDGCRWDAAVDSFDEVQLDIADYDPDVFLSLPIVHAKPGVHDPKDERTWRSHVAKVVSQKINKLICIPVLKDHASGGITMALKNMSHGLVNNVCRSHGTADTNTCNVFIPAICSMPILRQKTVLQVMDGLNAVYERGPGARREFVWPYKALFFATDPVAMDRIGWDILDAKRAEEGLPSVAEVGLDGKDPLGAERFDIRQPQHVQGAAALGLGIADPEKIDHRVIKLG